MGGGDLNLKKSWHPHTIKNQEKVWKAEQAKMSEDKRMRELQKEIRDEKERDEMRKHGQISGVLPSDNNPKLEWMYKNSSELLNRDEYLLGKSVDKNFEELDRQEKSSATTIGIKSQKNHVEHDVVPFSIREYKGIQTSEQVDLQRKLMEDPLMAIRQKEMESRRKILENPVKLKELHRILKNQTKKHKKKSKKHKKDSKRKKRRDSSSSSSEDDLDKLLVKQIKEIKKNATAKELEKILESKYQKISKELDKAAKNKKKKSKKKRKSSSDESSSNTPSPEPKRKYKTHSSRSSQTSRSKSPAKKRFSRSVSPNRKFSYHRRSRSLSRTPVDKNLDRKRSRSRSFHRRSSRSPHQLRHKNNPFKSEPRNFSRSPRKDNPFQKNSSHFGRKSISPRRRSPNSYQNARIQSNRSNSRSKNWGNPFSSSKHSEEEKQRRLKEMTQNAAWRDEDRTRHVQKYREDYRREEDDHRKREFDNDFVNKQVHKAYDSQNSVESRLKSHKNNIQRSAHSMNSNFARK